MTLSVDSLQDGFRRHFGRDADLVARAPGRLEILGNHTDYNEGVVLSAAVDRHTWVAIAASQDEQTCRIHDLRAGERREFRLDQLDSPKTGDWANYVKGLLVELARRDLRPCAFDMVLQSTVPISAGMSSSAALEMAALTAIQSVNGFSLDWQEKARIGQACENRYVGANTGLLDQFSSLCGRRGRLVYSDFRTLRVDSVPFPERCALVVADSGAKHVLTGEYNERRSRCEQAVTDLREAGLPDVSALRDVTLEQLERHKGQVDVTAFRRARHVVGENQRVADGLEDLRNGRISAFGKKLFASHESSRTDFENSCGELDILVEIARSLPGCHGARLSGGGFGGITVHLVEKEIAEQYAMRLTTAYHSRTKQDCKTIICHPGDGASVVFSRREAISR